MSGRATLGRVWPTATGARGPALRTRALALVLAVAACGCVHEQTVERAYDGGRVVEGRFIEAEAYAAFLRGAIAQAAGDAKGALAAYGEAVRADAAGAEIWARIGEVRCDVDPHDRSADEGFARALRVAPDSGAAWSAAAKCALARGDVGAARTAAERAASVDPNDDAASVLLARTAPDAQHETARAVLISLTVTASEPAVAWGALAAWAKAHGDVALWARALKQLARVAPTQRDAIAAAAQELAGLGELGEARAVASAAADADDRPLRDELALAARLAVDDAIARGDAACVGRRSTRVRVSLEEAAARALLAGRWSLARELAASVVRAEPAARGARLVLAVAERGDVTGAAAGLGVAGVGGTSERPSAAAFVAFGLSLVH